MALHLCHRTLLLNVVCVTLIMGDIGVFGGHISMQIDNDKMADDLASGDSKQDRTTHVTETQQGVENGKMTDSPWKEGAVPSISSGVRSPTATCTEAALKETQELHSESDAITRSHGSETVFNKNSIILSQRHSNDAKNLKAHAKYILKREVSMIFEDFKIPNKFLCLPCNCSIILDSQVEVKCITHSTMNEITVVLSDQTWSFKIRSLLISRSAVHLFQASDFVKYSCLHSLTVSKNHHLLKVVNSTEKQPVMTLEKLELFGNKIKTVDDRSFQNMEHLLTLSLSDNSLTKIKNFTFEGLKKLQVLNVSGNKIALIESGSFNHFLDLKVLDLSRNIYLGYDKPFTPDAFSRLMSLSELYIHGNDRSGKDYPNQVLGNMSKLTVLSIDGLPNYTTLGPQVKNVNLTTLFVFCKPKWTQSSLSNITESFFENVPYLQSLIIQQCPLQHVDSNAYRNINNVTKLELLYTYPYSIFDAFNGLEGLQNSTLKSLRFIGLITAKYNYIYLTQKETTYLKHIDLEEMDLSENRLAYIGPDFFWGLPRTLWKLVIRKNKLIEPYLLLNKLCFLEKLTVLDLGTYVLAPSKKGNACSDSDRYQAAEIAKNYNYQELAGHHKEDEEHPVKASHSTESYRAVGTDNKKEIVHYSYIKGLSEDLMTDGVNNSHVLDNHHMFDPCTTPKGGIKIPPNLRHLLAPRYLEMEIIDLLTRLKEITNSSIIEIDFSYCNLPNLGHNTVLHPRIEIANFNGNYMTRLPCKLFPPGNALRTLSLNNNLLGEEFAVDDGTIFAELKNVIYLDLSMNMIYTLSNNFFRGLKSLKILIMKKNKIEVLNTNFSNMPFLWYMSLRKNAISWIRQDTRNDLDIFATNHTFNIDLSLNPLRCTCEGLEILHWIRASKVNFVSTEFLRCLYSDGTVEDVGNIDDRVNSLQRSCVGKAVIIVLCVASLVVVCALVGFGLMYRYRWKLRYIRSIALSHFVGFKPRETTNSMYKFDAYILYSDTARKFVYRDCLKQLEVNRGRKLCLDERDFMPGTYAISAIVSAIQNSRKTVLIITPDFYEEEYSEYAVKMAIMEEIYTKRSLLYLCLVRPISDENICKCPDLLMVMKRNEFTEFPSEKQMDAATKKTFWDHLSQVIGPTDKEESCSSFESVNTNKDR